VVAYAANPSLAPHTDPYFRGFDNQYPDFYRFREWEREFSEYERRGDLPQLELVRFMHDHLGDFATAVDEVNTPERQVADNDYAVGLLVERVAHSRYAGDTLIFIVEDDAQDGPDHVDAHRSVAFIAGPCVRRAAVVSQRYTTVDLLRTIELVLGLRPLNLHDAAARPMVDAFDPAAAQWSYSALVPQALRETLLPLPPAVPGAAGAPPQACAGDRHSAAYWAGRTMDMDFSVEDRVDAARLNRILWSGQRGAVSYPEARSGADLSGGRAARLAAWAASCGRDDH
jgi:DNA-binding beta-propeller fold protein YncE